MSRSAILLSVISLLFLSLSKEAKGVPGKGVDSLTIIDSLINSGKPEFAKTILYRVLLENGNHDSTLFHAHSKIIDIGLQTRDSKLIDHHLEKLVEINFDSEEVLFTKGKVFLYKRNTNEAISLFKKLKDSDRTQIAIKSSLNLANCYYIDGKYEKALNALEFENSGSMDMKDSSVKLNLLGAIAYSSNQNELAIEYWENLKKIYIREGSISRIKDLIYNIHLLRINIGDIRGGLDYLHEYDSIASIIHNRESLRMSKDFEIKYDVQRKENEVIIAETKARNSLILNWVFGLSIVIIVPLLFWLTYSIKTIRAKNYELRIVQGKLESSNTRLEEMVSKRTKELEERNSRLERYAFATSHRLRKPLANILGLISLFPENQDNDNMITLLERSSEELDEAVKHMGEILDRKI